jgi:hypothetical protein
MLLIMKKQAFLSLFLLFSLNLLAQVQGNYQQSNKPLAENGSENAKAQLPVNLQETFVVLQSEVLYNAKPTHYLAIFAVNQEGENIAQTDTFLNQRLEVFKRGLQRLAISETDVYVDFVSLVPKYEVLPDKKRRSKTANELPVGFQIKKNIHIQFTDSRLLDKIISAAAVAEIYDLAKVEVDVPDLKKFRDEIAAEGLKIVAAKAARYTSLNMKVVTLSMGDNFEIYYPTEQYESYMAASTDYAQVQTNASFRQNKMAIKYASKDKTVFYNRLPYDQFDVVMNPNFVEPPIQIHYKVLVRYKIENADLLVKQASELQNQQDREERIRLSEVEIRKIQAANPPKTCCDKN